MAPGQAFMFDFDETFADTLPGRLDTLVATGRHVLGLDLTPAQALEVIRSGSNFESQMAMLAGGQGPIA